MSLELVPMEDEAPAAAPLPQPELPVAREIALSPEPIADAIEIAPVGRPIPIRTNAPSGDTWAVQAAREYAEGKIDQPLWDRALTQANGDETAAAAIYVRARAVALRLFERDRKRIASRSQAAVSGEEDDAPPVRAASAIKADTVWSRYRYAIIAVAVALPLFGIAAYWALSRGGSTPPVTAAVTAKAAAPVVAHYEAPKAAPPDFAKKVQDLRDAGNWNVLVLYAVEWTRKEPSNPAAWDNLRMGYIYLRQYDDALSAANKAVQLAPDDAKLWRHVGEVNLELDDPAAALAAFEQAAARNSFDLDSLHQVGLLNARLGRPQESKAAFDRAAAAVPGDAITTCLRTAVAQMPAARDAYSMSRQIRAIDNRCHGRGENVATSK